MGRQVIQAGIAVLGVALILWMETPAWQREIVRQAVRLRLRGLVARAARYSGHRAMGDELAGRVDDAAQGYDLAYRLSALRDKL